MTNKPKTDVRSAAESESVPAERLALEAAEIGIYERCFEPDQLEWSPVLKRIFGLPAQAPVSVDEPLRHIHPDDLAGVAAGIAGSFDPAGTGEYADEHRIVRADGTVRWIRVRGRTEFHHFRPYRACGAVIDITEQKQAEAAVRRSAANLRDFIENAPVGMHRVDSSGIILWANRAELEMLGCQPDEYIGHHLAEFHVDQPAISGILARLASNEPLRDYEARLRHRDGSVRCVLINSNALREDGRLIHTCCFTRDITERKRLEEKVRKQFDELENIYRTAPIGLALIDREFRFLRINERLAEINGVAAEDHIGRSIREIVPDVADQAEEIFRQVFETGQPVLRIEFRGATAAQPGVERVWDESWYPLKNDAGETICINVVVEEITARKRAEQALRESRARLAATQANAPIGIVETSLDGAYLSVNDEFCRITGYTRDELLKRSFKDLTCPEDYPRNRELFEQLTTGRVPSFRLEKRFVRKDGSLVWADVHRTLVRDADGKPLYVVGAIVDISERHQAAEVSARLAAIVSSSADAIIGKTLDGIITSWNAGAEAIFGYTAEEITGQPITRLFPPELVAEEEHILTRIRRGENIKHYETVRVTKDGRRLDVSLTISPIKDSTGKIIGASKILRDITDRKRAEAERERLLQSEQEARAEAEAATRARDEFLSLVSHELRNPLNSILGYSRLLRAQRKDDPDIQKFTAIAERNGQAQLQLIEDLLDTARITSGKLRLEPGPVALREIVSAVLETALPSAEGKNITLDLTPDETAEAYPLMGDARRLQQIVWNLLSNAIRFTPAGGRVRVELRRAAAVVQLVVRDTGRGISAELLPHVFERFRQGEAAASRRTGGLGLGLALVKELVELHGGTVEAASAGAGMGATFTVSLPLWNADREGRQEAGSARTGAVLKAPSGDHTPHRAMLQDLRVLVVDDEEAARELIALTLRGEGAQVMTAGTAAAAFAALEAPPQGVPFDLLVSDIGMPDEDGCEMLLRVRAHADPQVRQIPAVALTAYARAEDRLMTLGAGYQMHLAKPVEEDELTLVVASLTGRLMQSTDAAH